MAQTDGDAVLLLNADCFLAPGSWRPRCRAGRRREWARWRPKLLRVTAQGERLGQIDAAGMFVDRRRKNGLVGHGRPAAMLHATPAEAFGADGAAALYRRETLEDCALDGREVLDEDMELWASDADLAWRAQLLGWRCVYEPTAVAHHVRTYSPSTRAAGEPRRIAGCSSATGYLMMVKNETARRAAARPAVRSSATRCWRWATCCCASAICCGGYREAWRLLPAAPAPPAADPGPAADRARCRRSGCRPPPVTRAAVQAARRR